MEVLISGQILLKRGGGNDADKRARWTQADVDVFPNKESSQDYVFKFQEVQDSNQNSRTL